MDENISFILEIAKDDMDSSMSHLEKELLKVRAGKANPVMLSSVMVEYYGAKTPLGQVASVSAPDARLLQISPFDKSAIPNIEKGIIEANLGFNPSNDGNVVRVPVPALTEDRRRDLAKQAKAVGEHAKISLRNVRRDANEKLKALKNDGVSEDEIKGGEAEIQTITNSFGDKINTLISKKEEEIMTV